MRGRLYQSPLGPAWPSGESGAVPAMLHAGAVVALFDLRGRATEIPLRTTTPGGVSSSTERHTVWFQSSGSGRRLASYMGPGTVKLQAIFEVLQQAFGEGNTIHLQLVHVLQPLKEFGKSLQELHIPNGATISVVRNKVRLAVCMWCRRTREEGSWADRSLSCCGARVCAECFLTNRGDACCACGSTAKEAHTTELTATLSLEGNFCSDGFASTGDPISSAPDITPRVVDGGAAQRFAWDDVGRSSSSGSRGQTHGSAVPASHVSRVDEERFVGSGSSGGGCGGSSSTAAASIKCVDVTGDNTGLQDELLTLLDGKGPSASSPFSARAPERRCPVSCAESQRPRSRSPRHEALPSPRQSEICPLLGPPPPPRLVGQSIERPPAEATPRRRPDELIVMSGGPYGARASPSWQPGEIADRLWGGDD